MPAKSPSIQTQHPWLQIIGVFLFLSIIVIGYFEFGYVIDDNSRLWGWPLCGLFGIWGCLVHFFQLERIKESRLLLLFSGMYLLMLMLYSLFMLPITNTENLFPLEMVSSISPRAATLAWDDEATRLSFHQAVASFFFFIGVTALVANSRGKRFVFWSLIGFSLIEAALGLLALTGPTLVRGYGAYLNPNHHAAAIMLGLPLLGIWLFERANAYQEGALSQYQRDMTLLVLLIFIIAMASWLISLSRGSVLSTAFVVSIFLFLDWRRMVLNNQSTNRPLSSALITPMMIFLITVLVGMTIFTLLHRGDNESLGQDIQSRTAYWEASLKGLAETNFLGMGPQGSRYAINQYVTDFSLNVEPQFAHNDWLQTLCDFGIIGGIIILSFLVFMVRRIYFIMKNDWQTSKKWGGGRVYRWCVASICILLVHSFFDFHLRVPMLGFQVLALIALISVSPRLKTAHVF